MLDVYVFLNFYDFLIMGYPKEPLRIEWDKPGPLQGVTIHRRIDGRPYAWRTPWNGVVSQAMAADILGVSVMAVNNWVRAGTIFHHKPRGEASVIPLKEIKKVRDIMRAHGRLVRDALGK